MNDHHIQLYENQPIRTAWDEEAEEWYFSVVDVVGVLTDQPDARRASTYWAVLKKRLKNEGADQGRVAKCAFGAKVTKEYLNIVTGNRRFWRFPVTFLANTFLKFIFCNTPWRTRVFFIQRQRESRKSKFTLNAWEAVPTF